VSESGPAPPPLTESARSVVDAARNVAGAWGGSFAALRRLLVADLALARIALIQGLVLLFVAAILFGTAWALLTLLAVWAMHAAGVGWGYAIAVPSLLSLALGALAFWQAAKALRLADLDASRRQLTLWFGTLDEVDEVKQAPPGSLHAGAPPAGSHAGPGP
jgi:hypothetical protein